MISNCGKDERGQYSGGRAGDQTGGEYAVINWYNRPWNCVLRHPNASVRSEIARLARSAANNNNIGYDQYERLTFWNELTKVGYDPAQIRTPCEADCSSSTCAVVKAAGFQLKNSQLMSVSTSLTTHGMRGAFKAFGFDVLTDPKYLTSPMYLLAGDILLNDQSHVAINLDNGGYADKNYGNTSSNQSTSSVSASTGSATQTQSGNTSSVKKGDLVSIDKNASWWNGYAVPSWVRSKRWYVMGVNGNRAVLGKSEDGVNNVSSPISTNYLTVVQPGAVQAAAIAPPSAITNKPSATGSKTHRVQSGETLIGIANKYGVTLRAVIDANGIKNPNLIYVGQVIIIP